MRVILFRDKADVPDQPTDSAFDPNRTLREAEADATLPR
jgi:hypothetical protein